MNIYFHIDELKRDAIVASALYRKLEGTNHKITFGNRTIAPLLKYFHDAFDIIVLPRPHFMYDFWGKDVLNWKQQFIMLSTESLGIICKDHHVMAKTLLENTYFEGNQDYVQKISAFCVWGEKQKLALKEYSRLDLTKVYPIGHPRHDSLCQKKMTTKYEQKRTLKIGFVTRTNSLNDYYGRSAIRGFEVLFDDHFNYEYINRTTGKKLVSDRRDSNPKDNMIVQLIDIENLLKVLKKLSSLNFELSIRCHPKEDSNEWIYLFSKCGINAEIADNSIPITHWLMDKDKVIGPPSTSFYDAAMCKVEPISIENLDSTRRKYIGRLWEDNNQLMEHIYKPESIDELVQYLKKNRDFPSKEVMSILKEEANFPYCSNSLDKFITICKKVNLNSHNLIFSNLYPIISFLYTKAWQIKNIVIGRKENSSQYSLGRKNKRFIMSLTK
ncbi:hypothetical protein N9I31_03905 [Candidatus Pseudothioglobus singularis]|jgi:surface carbohydrate biosynthesis protein|nr:hypothetical protein [Candidatus Pseudothioglobus singularis]